MAVTVIRLSPTLSGASAEISSGVEASRDALDHDLLDAGIVEGRPETVTWQPDLAPTPLGAEGEVMTIFGPVVSLIGGLVDPVMAELAPVFELSPSS